MPITSRRIVTLVVCCACWYPPGHGRQNAPAATPRQVVDFTQAGASQNEALKVNDAIYQGIGFANTFMVTTPAGNVIIDTSAVQLAPQAPRAVDQGQRRAGPVHHPDARPRRPHRRRPPVEAARAPRSSRSASFPSSAPTRTGWPATSCARNAAQFNFDAERLGELLPATRYRVTPTITFDDRYDFELGGVKFEVFAHARRNARRADACGCPSTRPCSSATTMYDSFPNIYTLRGTPPRWALDYVALARQGAGAGARDRAAQPRTADQRAARRSAGG